MVVSAVSSILRMLNQINMLRQNARTTPNKQK